MSSPRRTPGQGGNTGRVTFSSKSPHIESWTIEQTAHLLSTTSLSPPSSTAARPGPSAPLSIPLDTPSPSPVPARLFPSNLPVSPAPAAPKEEPEREEQQRVHTVHRRRSPIRRDSQKRRDALLRGKEGSRRRQRWENDRLLHVPGAVAPLPGDWAVPCWEGGPRSSELYRPVPYGLAVLWEGKYAAIQKEREEEDRRERRRRAALDAARGREQRPVVAAAPPERLDDKDARKQARKAAKAEELMLQAELEKEQVARDLRARIKKARGARGLLQDLELEVRNFLMQLELCSAPSNEDEKDGFVDLGEKDDSDEEIVFVGRGGHVNERRKSAADGERVERLIFQSLERDHGASFGRWLVHAIANYYGLETWSITTGDPARREAYVGVRADAKVEARSELPRPLWVLV